MRNAVIAFICRSMAALNKLPCTSAALARCETPHVGRDHSHGQQGRAMLIRHRRAHRMCSGTRCRNQSNRRLRQHILVWLTGHSSGRPETRSRCKNSVGSARPQLLVSESELVHHAGPVILDDHVVSLEQAQHNLLPLRRLQVDCRAALVAAGGDEKTAALLRQRTGS